VSAVLRRASQIDRVVEQIEATRLLVYDTAARVDANPGALFPREASMCKLKATETAKRAAPEGMQMTGGYGYDRRIVAGLRTRGWTVRVEELDSSFPRPTPDALDHAARTLAALPDGTTVLVDGLAFGAMPHEAAREAARLRLIALVHLPLARETGLDPRVARALEAKRPAVIDVVTDIEALAPLAVA